MIRPKFIHELLRDLIAGMTFTVSFDDVTDNGIIAGKHTYTLNGVCDFHHITPGFTIHIDNNSYKVKDYNIDEGTITVTGTSPISVVSFELDVPLFVHGTPMQEEVELEKKTVKDSVPMVYLMEPYKSIKEESVSSLIEYTSDITLCFLTESKNLKWLTDDFYHNAITPMKNLMEDVVAVIKNSPLFYSSDQQYSPTYHTKFGINVQDTGTKKQYFSKDLSGVSVQLSLEVYKGNACECEVESNPEDGCPRQLSEPFSYAFADEKSTWQESGLIFTFPGPSDDPLTLTFSGLTDGYYLVEISVLANDGDLTIIPFGGTEVHYFTDGEFKQMFYRNPGEDTIVIRPAENSTVIFTGVQIRKLLA